MTNKATLLCTIALAVCLAASAFDQPGLISSGSTRSHDGWRLSYSTVAKPPLPGQHTTIQSGLTYTDADDHHPIVFHRFLADPAAKTYLGYDVVLETHGSSAKLRFRPIDSRPDQLPKEYQSTGSRILAIQQFPLQTFQSGQTIAIDLLTNPGTGQKVVDYIHVDMSYLDAVCQVVDDIVTAIQRHFEAHQRALNRGR